MEGTGGRLKNRRTLIPRGTACISWLKKKKKKKRARCARSGSYLRATFWRSYYHLYHCFAPPTPNLCHLLLRSNGVCQALVGSPGFARREILRCAHFLTFVRVAAHSSRRDTRTCARALLLPSAAARARAFWWFGWDRELFWTGTGTWTRNLDWTGDCLVRQERTYCKHTNTCLSWLPFST